MIGRLVIVVLLVTSNAVTLLAEKGRSEAETLVDPRGPFDLTVCSQNLKNYGVFEEARIKNQALTTTGHREREGEIVQRFAKAGCDVIAVQELLGKTDEIAKLGLKRLAEGLRASTNRSFDVRVGPPAEGRLTLGFLVAKDRAEVVNTASYDRVELPKLSPNQKPRLFSRGPLELQIVAKARETETPKAITLVNFHMKSQRGGKDDPAALEWETYRMEMAEGLRRIVERRHKQSFASGQSSLILLGDRNSHFDLASARIIEGVVTLESFRTDGACRLSKRGVPLCKTATLLPQRLFSVLTTNPRTKSLPGTFVYQGEHSWLDDILVPAESLPLVWRTEVSEGEYESGVVYTPDSASDHAMVFVRLNWF